MKLEKQLKEKDDLTEILERHAVERQKEQENLFFSSVQSVPSVHEYSDILSTSGAWKKIVDKPVLESAQLKRQKRKHQQGVGLSSKGISLNP
ncbi:unnamed protein product [Lathyrus sativus]|nr:unnamed protein product [Lathyrus sativus]